MKITVTLSANAGVALNIDGRRIWVDALHDRKTEGFSTLDPALQREMMTCEAFSHPEYICYTHLHPDHYSQLLTQVACQLWPNAALLMPGQSAQKDGLLLQYIPLPHEGEQYGDVEHYGMLISYKGCNVLIPGDCATASEALTQTIGDTTIHLALLNFPWITLKKGREYTLANFKNAEVVLYHLPFGKDDGNGYRMAARNAVDTLAEEKKIQLLWEPLQTVEVNF